MKADRLAINLAHLIVAREPTLIVGAPGIGKSQIAAQAAAAGDAVAMFNRFRDEADKALIPSIEPHNWVGGNRFDFIIRTPVHEDPTDSKGMPHITATEAKWIPFRDLQAIITARRPTVVDLEDLGQAPPLVQAGYMQMVEARQIGDFKVSPFVTFVASTNRKEDRAAVSQILEPVKSRFQIIHLESDAKAWCSWALDNDLPTEWIAFAMFKPEYLERWAPSDKIENSSCPRNFTHAAKIAQMPIAPDDLMEMLQGRIGRPAAADAVAFLQIWKELPSTQEVFLNPQGAPVPDRATVRQAFAAALAKAVTVNTMPQFITYLARLPAEISVFSMSMALRMNRRAITEAKPGAKPEALSSHRAYALWCTQNQDVLF